MLNIVRLKALLNPRLRNSFLFLVLLLCLLFQSQSVRAIVTSFIPMNGCNMWSLDAPFPGSICASPLTAVRKTLHLPQLLWLGEAAPTEYLCRTMRLHIVPLVLNLSTPLPQIQPCTSYNLEKSLRQNGVMETVTNQMFPIPMHVLSSTHLPVYRLVYVSYLATNRNVKQQAFIGTLLTAAVMAAPQVRNPSVRPLGGLGISSITSATTLVGASNKSVHKVKRGVIRNVLAWVNRHRQSS